MMKKRLIVLLAMLIVITACGQQGVKPGAVNATNTNETNNAGNNLVVAESSLDYCKMILKTAQTKVNTFERQEKTILSNSEDTKKKINDLKAKGGSAEQMKEEQADLDDLKRRLQETQTDLAAAKKNLADITAKCSKIAKKGDKVICNEFDEDIQKQTENAQNALAKEQANLENIKKQYDEAKAAGKSSEFLASINEEKEKKNLDILKIKNNLDKLGQMLQQLNDRC